MTTIPSIRTSALNRAFVGFDSLLDQLENAATPGNYPPYNISKVDDDHYRISIAATGFRKDEVKVTVEGNELFVTCKKSMKTDEEIEYLHHGLALRDFERTFTLAEHMVVDNATVEDGVLTIFIERVIPEDKKPRQIEIK